MLVLYHLLQYYILYSIFYVKPWWGMSKILTFQIHLNIFFRNNLSIKNGRDILWEEYNTENRSWKY